jgi:hypothetical protein
MIKLNEQIITPTMFPDKTSQVWKIQDWSFRDTTMGFIEWRFETEAEFLHVAQLKSLLDSMGYVSILHMPYLPYARQDHSVSNNTTFALHTFAKLLNSLSFYKVQCIDPHSSMASELIKNLDIIWPTKRINTLIEELKVDLVCYPDSGAVSKYHNRVQFPYIFGFYTGCTGITEDINTFSGAYQVRLTCKTASGPIDFPTAWLQKESFEIIKRPE